MKLIDDAINNVQVSIEAEPSIQNHDSSVPVKVENIRTLMSNT